MPEEKKKKFNFGSLKNWLILAAAGVGGYYLYQHFVKPELSAIKEDVKDAANSKPGVADPDLNGPMIAKFQIGTTHSNICIDKPDKRFTYAPIASVNQLTGAKTFSAPVTGHFTRRLLCRGTQRWAEIKPL